MSYHMMLLVVGVLVGANLVVGDKFSTVAGHSKKVVCYWGTWANYRPKEGKFTPESVDGTLCTHLIYSFAGLDAATSRIKSLDGWMDLEKDYGLAGFRKATDLKKKYQHLKVMIAIGGWNEGSTKYSQMARDPKKRGTFVNSTVDFLKKHKFDGLDLDWEYPSKRGGAPEDKKNFVLLARDLKAAFTPHKYLLTAAIGAGKATVDISYEVAEMYKYLDFVNVMAYDLHGKWDKVTGHNAPLRARPDEKGGNKFLNIEYIVQYLIKKGAKPEKTILGVPLYGRSFLLKKSKENYIGAPARSTSFAGPLTREQGFLGYNEVCRELTKPNHTWTVVWEKCHQAPYMVKGDRWVSYDDETAVTLKANFAWESKLGGVMVWSIETDDFNGYCSKDGVKFPLLRKLNRALSEKEHDMEKEIDLDKCDPADYAVKNNVPVIDAVDQSGELVPVADQDQETSHQPSPPVSGNAICVSPNEPNPDPTDCAQFYLCANGVPHPMTCRPGTLYSPSLMTCDHSFNVVCDADPDAVTPSATPSSSPTPWKPTSRVIIQVDDNHLDNQNAKPYDENSYLDNENTIENNYNDNHRPYHVQEDGMSAEKVVIIVLILLLLLILLICGWCFRSRLRVMAEPYWDNWTVKKMRKPSTAGLLQAYKKNKIHWPSLGPTKEEPNVPTVPPKDYSTAPPLPSAPPKTLVYNVPQSVAPPQKPVSFRPAPPNIPLPKIPYEREDTYSEITINSVPQPPPRNRRRSISENQSTA